MATQRIDKLLASTGRWSRQEAKALIKAGRVLVDGIPAGRGEQKADPSVSRILVDGADLGWQAHTYVMLNKPAGVLTATEDQRQKTVLDLLPEDLRRRAAEAGEALAGLVQPRYTYRVCGLERREGGFLLAGTGVLLTGSTAARMLADCRQAALL